MTATGAIAKEVELWGILIRNDVDGFIERNSLKLSDLIKHTMRSHCERYATLKPSDRH